MFNSGLQYSEHEMMFELHMQSFSGPIYYSLGTRGKTKIYLV